jgi:hypothetical protein
MAKESKKAKMVSRSEMVEGPQSQEDLQESLLIIREVNLLKRAVKKGLGRTARELLERIRGLAWGKAQDEEKPRCMLVLRVLSG